MKAMQLRYGLHSFFLLLHEVGREKDAREQECSSRSRRWESCDSRFGREFQNHGFRGLVLVDRACRESERSPLRDGGHVQ